MSVYVMKTMLLLVITYAPTFLAFTFGFHILLKNTIVFDGYITSMVKVLAMSIGELDYNDDFQYDIVMEQGGRNVSTQLMLLVFVLIMVLIVTNLLLAVTISSSADLNNKSLILQAEKRIKDVETYFNLFFHSLKDFMPCLKTEKTLMGRCKDVQSAGRYYVRLISN